MRSISSFFEHVKPRAALARPGVFACVLLGALTSPGVYAQDDDDLYGLPPGQGSPAAPSSPVEETPVDTATPVTPAPPPAAQAADTVQPAAPDTAVSPVAPPPVAPRPRVTRETSINPMDREKGNYRNPKKALFMSLLVPGLGQAYVGQSAFNYARAAFYFGTEVTLGALWYQYTVVKYDRKTDQYRRFADQHWSQQTYEQRSFDESAPATFAKLNPRREAYCEAVQERESSSGNALYRGCVNILIPDSAVTQGYLAFKNAYPDQPTLEETSAFRAGFADPVEFYALIGGYQEFISGWDDAVNVSYTADSISGTSANRDAYNRMRSKAQDYSRMQAWFIGGIVINHIASAVDAALTARYNNRLLYEGEARWYDRLKVDGGLAFQGGRPLTHMTARLSF